MIVQDAFRFRQIQTFRQREPKAGKYGLIHPDGTPCDAMKPENCPKMMGKSDKCANPRDDKADRLTGWDDLNDKQRKNRIDNAKRYLAMTGSEEGKAAYNERKAKERHAREEKAKQEKIKENEDVTITRKVAGENLSDEEVEMIGQKLAPVFGHGSEYSKNMMRRYFRDFSPEACAKFGLKFWWKIDHNCPPRLKDSSLWKKVNDAWLDTLTMRGVN